MSFPGPLRHGGDAPEGEDPSSFRRLPNEVVVHIFSFLDHPDITRRVPLVSSRFRDLCLSATLWTSLVLPNGRRLDTLAAHRLLDRYSSSLRELNVSKRSKDGALLAVRAVENSPKLQKLTVQLPNIEVFSLLTATSSSLQCLDVEVDSAGLGWGGEKTLRKTTMFRGFPNLTEFVLFHQGRDTVDDHDDTMRAIGANCPKIRVVNIGGVFSDGGVDHFLDATKNTLKSLKLLNFRHHVNHSFLGLRKCRRVLEQLSITGTVSQVGLDSIFSIASLRSLYLSYRQSDPVDYRALSAVVGGLLQLVNLAELTLWLPNGHTGRALTVISSKCPELVRLTLLGLGGSDSTISRGLRLVLGKCGKLQHLELSWGFGVTHPPKFFLGVFKDPLPQQMSLLTLRCTDMGGHWEENLEEVRSRSFSRSRVRMRPHSE